MKLTYLVKLLVVVLCHSQHAVGFKRCVDEGGCLDEEVWMVGVGGGGDQFTDTDKKD